MKKVLQWSLICALMFNLVACGSSKAPAGEVEEARKASISNAESNAKQWRNANKPEAKVNVIGDSMISNECPMGDGWSTVKIQDEKGTVVAQLKCSTYSNSLGCLTDTEYKERKQYSGQDGKCGKDWVPYPIKTLESK